MIHIEETPWRVMCEHAEAAYPDECCGVMLGSVDEVKMVIEAMPMDNAAEGSKRAHYVLAPDDLVRADRAAAARGLDLIGIYHSHPDCDAYFSETDLKNSCSWYSFVVLSVEKGKFNHANCWLPDAEQTQAVKEEISWQKS